MIRYDYDNQRPVLRIREKEMIYLKGSNTFINRLKWKGGIYKLYLSAFGDTEEIKKWVEDNLSNRTKMIMLPTLSFADDECHIFFKTTADIVAFKLRWI